MPTFYDSRNQPHALAERLGSGGEGTVYACAADYNLVAKIYHEPVSDEKAEKLRWMAANQTERLLKVSAWVVDVLHDAPGGKTIGFLMPNVKAKEIHELYSLKSRRVYFPDATWHFLVNTAANVARAFYNLHAAAHIMGDVNHGNCVVMRDGTVKLIDCDSYSIKTDERRYRCDVGVATHLAPELQNVNLRSVERENKHDNFGLAVIIFQLLFLGRHPFSGNYLGGEDKSLEDCIREYRFAYGANAALKNVRQPPGTLQLSAVSPRVAVLFERAFLTEDRPEPREWIEALEDLSRNLQQCELHPGHLYFNELDACPWCEIEAQTGLMLFPFVTSGAHLDGEKPFNIFTVENLIASFGIQNNLPAKITPAMLATLPPPPPSPEIIEARKNRRKHTFVVVPVHLFGLFLLMWMFGAGAAFYFGILFMICAIAFLKSSEKSAREPLEEILADSQRKREKIEKERTRGGASRIIGEDLIKIRKKVADYQTVQSRSAGELKRLQADATQRELYKYLHSRRITDAEIPGVDAAERKKLFAANVKTAAEIDANRLRYFYKIDDETTRKLLEWRERLVADFDTDASSNEVIKSEQTRFIDDANGERRRIERDIEQLLILLRGGAVHIQKQQRELFVKSQELASQISQTEIDLKTLGSNLPVTIALILISLFAPVFGALLNADAPKSLAPRVSEVGFEKRGSSAPPLPAIDYTKSGSALLYGENMTDEEVSELLDEERAGYAASFHTKAMSYNYGVIDRVKAEKNSRQALRFAPDDPRYLNELGYALYGQGKHGESLLYLNRSLEIEERNSGTKIFIGMNYLAIGRFNEAARILNEVTAEYSYSFEGFYNLGLAYNRLNNYVKAEAALRRASEINPDDADTHYQLGFCLYKLKKRAELRREYDTLVTLDDKIAQRLWADTNLDDEPQTIVQPAPISK